MLKTNNYVIHVNSVKFRTTSFFPVLKAARKIAISSSFQDSGPPQNQNLKLPPIEFDLVLNPLLLFSEFSTRENIQSFPV